VKQKAIERQARKASASILEMIDLLDGRISKRKMIILEAAYLILRLIGVRVMDKFKS
jgi:hypothetical protein